MANPFGIIESLDNFEKAAGEFIRDGPSTGLPGYVRDGYRKRCDQFANLPPWAKLLGNGPSGALDRICTPYWDDNGWDGPVPGVPAIVGGQCEERYSFNATTNRGPGTQDEVYRIVAWGPITGARVVGPGTPSVSLEINCRGLSTGYCFNSFPVQVAQGWHGFAGGSNVQWTNPTISAMNRCSGSGDPCGDSPVEGPSVGPNPPPDPGPLPGPEPTDDPDNPTGPPLTPLPPYQDPIYGPTPIVGPTGPSGDPGDPAGGTPPPPPGDIGDPGSPSDTADGGETEGEAPEGSTLVGLKVDVLTSPPKARQFAPGVFRGACYIYMGVASNLDQDYGGSMLKSGQFFFAEKENLTHWLVSANPGYNHRVTPYYRETEE